MVPPWREPEQFTSLLFDALVLYAARTRTRSRPLESRRGCQEADPPAGQHGEPARRRQVAHDEYRPRDRTVNRAVIMHHHTGRRAVVRPYMERWALTSFEMEAIHGTVRREASDCIRRGS